MKKMTALALITLLVAGCQHFQTNTQKIAAACASATSSIQIATMYKTELTHLQTARVEQAISVIQPVCGDRDTVPSLDSAKRAVFNAAVDQLVQIATEVQK